MQDLAVSREQVKSLFTMPLQRKKDAELAALPQPQGLVMLQNLSYGFQENRYLFENITLDIHPGEVIAISGDKGSGKSTLLQLMAGAVTPVSGKVTLDGIAPSDYSLAKLTRHIG